MPISRPPAVGSAGPVRAVDNSANGRHLPGEVYLDPYWEVLFLPDGDVLFNHLHGQELRLRSPSSSQRRFLAKLDEASDHPFDLASGRVAVDHRDAKVASLVKALLAENAIRSAGMLPRPGTFPEGEFQRFRSFLAWLGQFSGEPYGVAAFQKLRRSRVAVVGAGGAGSLCAAMLAACGIGHLKIADGDRVESSNLVRQFLYTEAQVGAAALKVAALEEFLGRFSSFTKVTAIPHAIQRVEQFADLASDCDLLILTADQPRVLVNRIANRACVDGQTPLLYCFVERVGPLYIPGISPCFECLEAVWRGESGTEYDAMVAAFQRRERVEYPSMVCGPIQVADALVVEAIGYLSGAYAPRTVDGMLHLGEGGGRIVSVPKRPDCPACGRRKDRRVHAARGRKDA